MVKKFNRGNIYLSGGMQFAKNLGSSWRQKASKKLKKMDYFPLDIAELDIAYNKKHGKPIKPNGKEDVLLYKASMRKHFIHTDLKLIEKNSDAIIVYYDDSARKGAGTVSEAQYAFNHNIPIFLVAEYPSYKELHDNVSGWLLALTTKYFISFKELFTYLDSLPYGILKKDIYGNHGVGNQYLCHLSGDVFKKRKNIFVSQIHPLYSQESVSVVHEAHTKQKDRYDFFMDYLANNSKTPFFKN